VTAVVGTAVAAVHGRRIGRVVGKRRRRRVRRVGRVLSCSRIRISSSRLQRVQQPLRQQQQGQEEGEVWEQ
jgi:hypothetical protein